MPMSDDDEPQMMRNRRYEVLEELLELARQAGIAEALDRPFQIMSDGDAWTGPTKATEFTEDIGHRRGDLVDIAEQLIEEIDAELQVTPEEVPWVDEGVHSRIV
jgi:hypothetical protein